MEPVVYLDYNATAPLRPEALAAMLPVLRSVGNAASPHAPGRAASDAVARARQQLADLLGCSPNEIIFTSGATEANNMALRAAVTQGGRLVTSAVEHPAVLETARVLARERELDLIELPVDADGLLELDTVRRALEPRRPTLVSIMAANNETGVLTNLEVIADLAHAFGAILHTDATQLVGKLPINVRKTGVDLMSLSAHKFGGPQGIGAVFIRHGIGLHRRPFIHGGEQERGWRAGTLNVAGVVGMGAAAVAAAEKLTPEIERVSKLRDLLEWSLLDRVEGAHVNGAREGRLPHVSSISFEGAPADAVLTAMPEVAASDGSACASGTPSPSHVLLAMGLSSESADCTIRFSLGYATTKTDIDHAVASTIAAVARIRAALRPLGEHSAIIF